MIRDITVRDPNAGKRKRIPLVTPFRQVITIKKVVPMPGDQDQQHQDDRDPDMLHHFRISARLDEERRNSDLPSMGNGS